MAKKMPKIGGVFLQAESEIAAINMRASKNALQYHCKDVLWLDARDHKYVEEIGTSNAFFRIDDEVITAPLDTGTILPGITRDSVLQLLHKWGVKASERRLSIDDVLKASKEGRLQEVFASGTAAVISPIGWLTYEGKDYDVADNKVGPVAQRLYDALYGMLSLAQVQDDTVSKAPGIFTSFFGPDPFNLLCVVILTSLGTWSLPQMTQKFYAIKNEAAIVKGTVISTLFAFVVAGGCYFLGGFGRLLSSRVDVAANGYDSIIPTMFSSFSPLLISLVVILVLSAFRVDVRITISLSVVCGGVICMVAWPG